MKGFTQEGSQLRYISYDENALIQTIKPQVYSIGADMTGLFLSIEQSKYDIPPMYGDVADRAKRILSTYKDRTQSTGVLLTGDKGSGKTMLTKVVANKAIDAGLPIIVVSKAFNGDAFNALINGIGECVLLFDEFAKVYNKSEHNNSDEKTQGSLLSFLDGLSSTHKRLLLFTENNEYDINSFMLNRPGRIFYHFRYTKLDETIIKEVLTQQLTNQSSIEQILMLSRTMQSFSFDVLNAIIEEANRYPDESILELTNTLNIAIPRYYDYSLQIDEVTYDDIICTPLQTVIDYGDHLIFEYDKVDSSGITSRRKDSVYLNEEDKVYETSRRKDSVYLKEESKVYEDLLTVVMDFGPVKVTAHKVPAKKPDYSKYAKGPLL